MSLQDELSLFAKGALRSELQEQFQCFTIEFQDTLRKEIKQVQSSLNERCTSGSPHRGVKSPKESSALKEQISPASGRPPKSGSFNGKAGEAKVIPSEQVAPSIPGMILSDADQLEEALREFEGNNGLDAPAEAHDCWGGSGEPILNDSDQDDKSADTDGGDMEFNSEEGFELSAPQRSDSASSYEAAKPFALDYCVQPYSGREQKRKSVKLDADGKGLGKLNGTRVLGTDISSCSMDAVMATLIEEEEISEAGGSRRIIAAYSKKLVGNPYFDYVFGILIFLNAISMGIQTEFMAQTDSDVVPAWMQVIDSLFCLIFLFELSARLGASGLTFFCDNKHWQWNWFDCVLVTMQLTEELILIVARVSGTVGSENESSGNNLSFLRVLRVLRLVRLVRLARVLRFVRQLRTLVCSIGVSLQSLGWTVMLIMLMIYVVGIYLTQTVSSEWLQKTATERESETFIKLEFYFGTLGRSVLTLFEAITGGVDWDELAHPLTEEVNVLTGVFFACYIAFAVLAMMNVVTGVFVESALQGSAQDKEAQIIGTLQDLFLEFDTDGSGQITEDEFNNMMTNAKAQSHFKGVDVSMMQAKSLFHLIDIERSGVIDIDAFIMGCLRLRGTARAADMTTLIFELKRFMSKWQTHATAVEDEIKKRSTVLSRADSKGETTPGDGSDPSSKNKRNSASRTKRMSLDSQASTESHESSSLCMSKTETAGQRLGLTATVPCHPTILHQRIEELNINPHD